MKRLAIAALFFFVALDASAQTLNDVKLDVVSHGLWRGFDLGGRVFAEPRVDFGLFGRPATTLGTRGADLSVEGWIPVSNGGIDLASARARYLWYFGEEKQTSVAAGVRESHWGTSGPDAWTTELSIEARGRITRESAGLTAHPFVEIARDLNRYKATYARVGLDHEIGAVGFPVQGEVTVYASASDYRRSFGWHDAQATAWVIKRLGDGGARIGVGGGYDRVARIIGRSRWWGGVRFQLLHS